MSDSGGLFSLGIGTGNRTGSGFEDTSTLIQVFGNSGSALTGLTCTSGSTYTSATGQKRKIKISFDDGTGAQTFSQALDVYAMPYALYADTLQGKVPSDFIHKNQTTAVLTQANLESVFQSTSYVTELLALINGTSTKFTKSSTNGTSVSVLASAPSTPTAGNLWFDSGSNLMKYYDGAVVQSLAASGGGVTNVTSANSYLSVATGTSTPQLTLNVGTTTNTVAAGNDSRITGAFQSSTALGGDLSGTLPNPTVAKIQTRSVSATAPSSASQVLKYDGSSQWAPNYINISDLRSTIGPGYAQFLPTNCSASQTFAYSSPSDVMTCTNITLTSGAITGLGTAAALNVGTSSNQVVQLDSSARLPAVDGSLLTGLTSGAISGLGTAATLNVGTTSNQVVQLDSSARLPAVDGSLLTGLPGPTFPMFATSSGSAASPAYSFSGDSNVGFYNPAADNLAVATGGTERIRIDSSGYIGLGTTAPIAPFHLLRTSGNADLIITSPDANNAEVLLTGSAASFYPGVSMAHVAGALQFTKVTNGSPSSYPWISANGATGLYSFTAITGSPVELKMSLQRGNGLSAVTAGMPLARISFDGQTGSGYSNSATAIQGVATQTFSASVNGASLLFLTTPNGTVTPLERMRIDQSGSIGIGTNAPSALLHVAGNAGGETIFLETLAPASAGPKIKLTHGGTGGVQYQIASSGAGDTEGAGKFVIRDFTSALTRMVIDNAGKVGIGTTAPVARFEINDTSPTTSAILIPRAATFSGTAVNGMIRYHSGSNLFEFYQNGAWVNFTTASDARMKTNIEPVENGLSIIKDLRPVYFDWDPASPRTESFEKKHQVGFLAQEVERVLPEVVSTGADSYRTMSYGNIVAVAVAAVKELDHKTTNHDDLLRTHHGELADLKMKNELLRVEFEAKERELSTLKARLERLENKFNALVGK